MHAAESFKPIFSQATKLIISLQEA